MNLHIQKHETTTKDDDDGDEDDCISKKKKKKHNFYKKTKTIQHDAKIGENTNTTSDIQT